LLKKQATSAAKKTTHNTKKATPATKKATPNAKNAIEAQDLETMPDEIKTLAAAHEPAIEYLPPALMSQIITDVSQLMYQFQQASDNNLTQTQRRRKIGAGVRNYSFIEKVADLAAANPEYAQFFHPAALRLAVTNIDNVRSGRTAIIGKASLAAGTVEESEKE
jgi:hypothetical protein